ncbi:MAG: glycosyltransferase [Candidatus Marinimicrobia bacterium]|nr:glycosyltransferase [Candidatus Neomarinimicrobiota bacterium]MCF7828834.1 glycosyltransferase [Candidatus Neomarinimicrobiota bacterium]MCF7880751.1 glycosyltransferase [Candidatus Neomarinimicrobiota bacterium]
MPTELSIVIVTYNSGKDIDTCLDSVFRQAQFFNAEIIVVDNNSRDNTLEVVNRYREQSTPLITITNEENRYFAPAVNQGLDMASGGYLLILNPDTRLEPEALSLLLGYIRGDRKTGVVAPQLVNPDGTIQPSCRRFPRPRDVAFNIFGINRIFSNSEFFNGWKMGDFDHRQIREVDQPQGAALLTSKIVLNKVGGFDEDFPMFFNDVDWCFRVKQAGYRIVFNPQAKVVHTKGTSVNRYKVRMVIFSHVSFFRFFEKHYDRVHQQLFNLMAGMLLYFSIPFRVVGIWVRSLIERLG